MTNKTKKLILLTLLLFFLFLGWQTFAQGNLEIEYPTIPGAERPEDITTPLPLYLKYIYNFSIFLAGILSFILILWGGVKYLIAGPNPSKMAEAKEQITVAFVGIMIIFASYLILNTISPELVLFPPSIIQNILPVSVPPVEITDTFRLSFQEIPLGTMITSEIGPSMFVSTSTASVASSTDPDCNLPEYFEISSNVLSYSTVYRQSATATSTDYQGALEGRRLKRIHEVASTTLPVVKMLADLSGELADLETKLKDANGELVMEAIKCSCFLNCERPCDFGLTALVDIFQGDIDNVDDFGDISNLYNFDVGKLIGGLDIMDIISDFISCLGPCRGDCDSTGDPCPNRDKMNKLREETIPAFYEGEESPILCKIAEIEYMSAAFQPFLDGSSYLVKNEDYEDDSFYWTEKAKESRAKIQNCIDSGSDGWEKAGLAKKDHEKIEKQFEEIEDLIDLMAEVEDKGTHSPKTDPPERDIETNIKHLEKQLEYLLNIKYVLNPHYNPQPFARTQFFADVKTRLESSFEEVEIDIFSLMPEDLRAADDPATFYRPPEFILKRQSNIVFAQEPLTCARIVEIPIGKTLDEAIKLIQDILREVKNIRKRGHLIIDNLIPGQIKLSEKTFDISDDLIDLTTEEECGMCEEECQEHCLEIKLPTPIGTVDVAHICYCTGIPCPLVEIILKWADLVFNVGIINKLYDNPGEPINSVFETVESVYESFYKLNSEFPEQDPRHPDGHPEAGERVPIEEDTCCTNDEGDCRDDDGNLVETEERDYTLIEKLIWIQKLLNRSRKFENFEYLIEQLGPLLADEEEIDNVLLEQRIDYTNIGGALDLTNCTMLYADMVEYTKGEESMKLFQNCQMAKYYGQIKLEICNPRDPPLDCDYFNATIDEKKSSLNCYCYEEVWYPDYPDIASNFFCCVTKKIDE